MIPNGRLPEDSRATSRGKNKDLKWDGLCDEGRVRGAGAIVSCSSFLRDWRK
ncbi:hypothetical protein TorRG33x02_133830 [Trema orientale]|uniref:Uncharacterized protein n=1 Tax=Trema orientale TaxID=63057 RepID=A0A2P5EYX9_TREOI|nr:hypothetical protein TorRG33x02_133830 [Trema orientale]